MGKPTDVDARPLIHHVWPHSKEDSMEIASFGGIAEHLLPCRLLYTALGINGIEDLLQLSLHLLVVEWLIQQSTDNMLGLHRWSKPLHECWTMLDIPHQSVPSRPAILVSRKGTDITRGRLARTRSGKQPESATAGSYRHTGSQSTTTTRRRHQ